ncbi:undecaprenyl/decaprenyl-phosphate alpha-N-acetylglucosaminyl 1-phosphate transferase [Streptomyces sp. YU58]|uniref:undecaprenyl/decaprenyl-phosphate alpha-N-acetylglucosaminyl 1-phosphate transferase n=1 Tax=Streptomyces sp. SX92 TaxID=3158972 RepID=UPI0027BA82F0|nr:undecaprenyl/decaprenyl-phosphate alpha-N-acetylglucosaminyl 1-phosphate transferase [Streptomyces coralus]WLW53402.1 undecaprenyl/decaprenyl-phosphate alpha-N-acetylglucosaminyl 1-phosphate transferase [Streptomyces coralus]
MLYGITAATSALFLAAVLATALRPLALRLGIVDRRWRRPLPLSGGVAVVLAVGVVAGVGQWTGTARLGDGVGRLLAGAVTVAVLGFVADVRRVKMRFLVGGTALAAACVVPYAETGPLAGALAVGWIVFVALGFKALDHADGLAGTVGVVTAFGVGICAAAEVMDGLAVLLSVLAAALTGFLMPNWPPARVGLGAGGALFGGFLLAAAAVTTQAGRGVGSGAGVLFALTAVVAADVLLVVLARRPLLRGGPDHLAHRLGRLGLTARGATVVLGVGASCGVLVAVLVHLGRVDGSGVLWVAAGALVVVLALLRIKPHSKPHSKPHIKPSSSRRSMNTQVRAQLRVRNG